MALPDAICRFGPYELRTRTRELYKQGIRLRLRPQPFQVLHALVERAGDVVTREELRKELWPSDTFVDFEHGLNNSIKELRGVLGDSTNEPRYIETLPKLGYRIVVPVEVEKATSKRAHWVVPVGLAAILILGLTGYWQWTRAKAERLRANERRMLAVLPFENLTGDASQDYFSDGLTEEMISQLGRLDPQHLGVIARTSVMHYKHSQETLQQVGRELGVNYVLEGSVRRDSGNVRISAQLIQVKDQTHLWTRQYDRQISSLLVLQGEIAKEVADEIHLTFDGMTRTTAAASRNLSPQSLEAYDLYLRGRYFWNKRTKDGLEQAAESFKQAIAKDQAYAPAYAGLADTYALMGNFGPAAIMLQARAAALKALQLDERLAEAHTSLALITENYDYDWQTAGKEYRRAIELNPNYATAHHWYAEYLMWLGRFDEALQESERARQLDPLSLIIAADRGAILYYAHQYDAAIEQLRAVLAIDPHFGRANVIYSAYLRKGLYSEVLASSDKDLSHCAADPWVCGWLVYLYAHAGQHAQAQRALRELERLEKIQPIRPEPLIAAHIAMGHKDEAFRYLEKAYSEHSNLLTGLRVEQVFDPLRSDPRFQDLLRRVRLAE